MDMLNILTQAPYYSGCLSIGIYLESILAFKLQNIRYSFKNLCYFKIFHLKIPFCKWTQINAEMSFRTLRFCHSERSEESQFLDSSGFALRMTAVPSSAKICVLLKKELSLTYLFYHSNIN